MQTITMKVEGMSCGHCQMRVKKALEGIDGVTSAEVDLINKQASIQIDNEVDASLLKQAVEKIGFTAQL